MRTCSSCGTEKADERFKPFIRGGKQYRLNKCRDCENIARKIALSTPAAKARLKEYNRVRWLGRPEAKARAAEVHKAYYQKHADAYRARARERHHRCWSERLIYSATSASRQRTARGRHCPVSVTKEHLESLWEKQGGFCFFSGVPMSKDRDRLDTVSIDRLDSSKGYEPGNVVLALKAMNFAKTGHSETEFRDLLDRVADAIVASRKLKSVA